MSTSYFEKLVAEDLNTGTSTASVRNPGGGSLTGTQINLATFAVGAASGSATWNPGSIAVGSMTSTTVTVTGAALGDYVLASFSLDIQELSLTAAISATNTVEVVLANNTSAAVDLASGTVKCLVFRTS